LDSSQKPANRANLEDKNKELKIEKDSTEAKPLQAICPFCYLG
jgi:hypothetical protein